MYNLLCYLEIEAIQRQMKYCDSTILQMCAYDYVDEQMEGWFEQLKDDVRIVQVYIYVYILDTCI